MLKKVINDKTLGLEMYEERNPKIRIGARGIIIGENNNIAIIYKKLKKEYKLPGGGVEEGETPEEAFLREAKEETGCQVSIIKKMGTVEEHKTKENFVQISHVYIARVSINENTLKLTQKEKEEGTELLWCDVNEGYELISNCISNLKPSKYDDLYRSIFMPYRDKEILEYYMQQEISNNK